MTDKAQPNNTDVLKAKATGNNTDAIKKAAPAPVKPDKPVEKAIKAMKAVVVEAEKPATKAIVSGLWDDPLPPALAPKRIAIDPAQKVMVNGAWLAPVAVDLKSNGGYMTVDGTTIYLPYPNHRYEDLTFSAYYIGGTGKRNYDTLVILDEFSTVTLENGRVPGPYGRSHNRRPSSVIMVNSSSKNDSYYGENYLINVDSEENTLNDSRLEAKGSVQGYSWEYGAYANNEDEAGDFSKQEKFVTGQSLRHRYERCQFKKTTVIDSKISEGYYSNCHIYCATIKASNRCNLTRSEVKKTEINGSDITMRQSHLKACTISCEGVVHINAQRMVREQFNTSALYLINKFCQMEVTLPRYNDLKMIRISESEFELVNSAMRSNFKITMTGNPFQIRKHVIAFLKATGPTYDSPEAPNAFMESMIDYVVDSITSRISMVAMLDSARQATRALSPDSDFGYDNPYGD